MAGEVCAILPGAYRNRRGADWGRRLIAVLTVWIACGGDDDNASAPEGVYAFLEGLVDPSVIRADG